MNINLLFEHITTVQTEIDEFNHKLFALDERKRDMCTIRPTDSGNKIRKKCKVARVWGIHHAPVWDRYMQTHDTPADVGGGEGGADGGVGEGSGFVYPSSLGPEHDNRIINDDKSSTERVRKYYRRHPEKVRKYLKKTQDDRVARNRDRRKAVKKYGKSKMKNHDVHHPNGAKNGNWRLAKKDHGRDKKNENVEHIYLSELMEGYVPSGKWQLIVEGGAAGHMAHPYEDEELTFADMKEMVTRGLVGGLDAEAPVTEKLDGQNITFSVRDGRVVFARNKGHVKSRGQDALDVQGMRDKFDDKTPAVRDAFVNAAEDLEAAIAAMPPEQQQEMFGDGRKFMNVEIINPNTKNVIPYGKSVLVFHGTIEYDDAGSEVDRDVNAGRTLERQLQAVNAEKQQTFGISGPQPITFNDADTVYAKERMRVYGEELARLQAEYGLDDNATMADYQRKWWEREIQNTGIDWTSEEREGLLTRWATGKKSAFNIRQIKDPEKRQWVSDFEKTQLPKLEARAKRPFERFFLRLGADVLLRVTNTLAANNPGAADEIRQEVLSVIKQVRETGTEKQLEILQTQLERLEDIGMDNVVPSEGVVFMYKGKPYKFTGTFAPVNQILGTIKYDRGGAKAQSGTTPPEPTPQEAPAVPKEEPTSQTPDPATSGEPAAPQAEGAPRRIAVLPGRFQPFHAGHYSIYQSLVQQFGKDNVYIVSSNKTDPTKSPFDFNEKREIMTKMFGIPEDRIVQVATPYAPRELTAELPPNTVVVTAVSEKDSERLTSGKYYEPYDDKTATAGYRERGYYIIAPEMQLQLNGKNVSGTQVRALLGNPKITDDAKKEIFTRIYGKFDPDIYKKMVKVTTDSEEALQLTQQYGTGADKNPRAKKEPATSPEPAPAQTAAAQPAAAPTASPTPVAQPTSALKTPTDTSDIQHYEPGDTWRMPKGNFGGKNSKGRIQYFGSEERARTYASK